MAVRGAGISKRFDAIKKANPGMSDSAAMQKAISESSKAVAKERRSSDFKKTMKKKRKRLSPLEKLRMGVTKELSLKHHSPKGQLHKMRGG